MITSSIQYPKSPTGWGFLLAVVITGSAHADMNDCMKETNQDKKNLCMATYSGSSTFCERLKNFETKTQCMRMVVAKQRQAQYGITIQKEKQGEDK